MKKQAYPLLRGRMKSLGMEQVDIQSVIGRSPSQTSLKMCGKADFTLTEQYLIMDFLEIPYTEMAEYFPPDCIRGKSIKMKTKMKRKRAAV